MSGMHGALAVDRAAIRIRRLGLQIPDVLDLEALRENIEQLRGRRLHLFPIRVPAAVPSFHGMAVAHPTYDAVYYGVTLSRYHAMHNALHELAHVVFGHLSTSAATGEDPEAEAEAEAFAAVLLGGWGRPAPASSAVPAPLRAGVVRLATALG